MNLVKIEVGKPFPGPVPMREGCVMELGNDAIPHVFLQFPGCTRDERQAFRDGFKTYCYLESGERAPVAYWIFNFRDPVNPSEVNFDARLVAAAKPGLIEKYLDEREGLKNAMLFYLLDGQIVQGQKLVGLQREAIRLFHATIRRQLVTQYTAMEYVATLRGLEAYSTEELCRMGNVWRHGE